MDDNNMNSPEVAEETTPQETPQQPEAVSETDVAETPTINKTELTTEPEAKASEKADTTDGIDLDFVKGAVGERLGEVATPELMNEFVSQLKSIGITDRGMAQRAIDYVIRSRANFMEANTTEALKHFGATQTNFTPEYMKAVSEASVALNALEAKTSGLKATIERAGLQSDLRIILALQKLYPLIAEDSNLMNGGTNGTAAPKSDADIIFGDMKPLA